MQRIRQRAFRIERMEPEDIPAMCEIEKASHIEPWTGRFFMEELDRPQSRILVARKNGLGNEVIGYICYWTVADEIQIFNLAVHPAHRRKGIGRQLLLKALKDACAQQARIALLEVRAGNEAAKRLYGSLGFRPCGLRPGYYGVVREPAVLMELEMDRQWRRRWFEKRTHKTP